MKKPKITELEALDRALKPMEDGLDFIPRHFEQDIENCDLKTLHGLLHRGNAFASIIMAQKGWVLMMIKRKVGFGKFKNHLSEIPFNYKYAVDCMNVARAIGRHPDLAAIADTHLLRRVVYLPEAKQAEIEVEFTRTNPITKKKQTFKELQPWLLQQVAGDIRAEQSAMKKATQRSARKDSEEAIEELSKKPAVKQALEESRDKEWMSWLTKYTKLRVELERFGRQEIKPEWYDRIFEREMLKPLASAYQGVVKRMHPLDEVRKRAEIVHAPGFAR